MKCTSCNGEAGLGKFCQYRGSEVPKATNGVITITIKGDMNEVKKNGKRYAP